MTESFPYKKSSTCISAALQSVEEVHSSLSIMKERTFLYVQQSMTTLSIWRSVRSTPVDQRDDRDPARREAAEEAWARAHGKRAISFGKYDFITFSIT
ncbi:hypothetical protein BBI11_15360 [Planococcus maritimus]|nr:hypothetical protein BBI11_15360 [Planococcus maritimus]